jgi:hypothetical protein
MPDPPPTPELEADLRLLLGTSGARYGRLERQLRQQGVRWLRQPHWSRQRHDLAVVDMRLAVERSVKELPGLVLEPWVTERVFRADPDVVSYTVTTRAGKKGMCPDGYFVLLDLAREWAGLPARLRFLLEPDGATHDAPSFGYEKAGPGWAYLRSPACRARFGDTSGRSPPGRCG